MGRLKAFSISLFGECQKYWVGSEIKGSVYLKLSKEMPMKAIKLVLSGVAHVTFSDGNIQGSTIYSNSEDICTVTWTLWDNECSQQQQVLGDGLPAGQHEFPFAVQIPTDLALPTSFESGNGFIRYSLIAGISRYEETKLEHHVAEVIMMKSMVDARVPHLMQPLSNFNQRTMHSFWHNYGPVSLSVIINRGGYCPGESISIKLKAENQSTRRVTTIQACLVQTVTYCGRARSLLDGHKHLKNYCTSRIIQSIEGSGIAAGETGYWNDKLLLIPLHITPSTIGGHHVITLSYSVDVILVLNKTHKLNVVIPVTIGTTPLQQQMEYFSSPQDTYNSPQDTYNKAAPPSYQIFIPPPPPYQF